jgi:predicted metalloprotease
MTFHEGTQIDTSTTSSSGGPGGRGIAIGGGLGGLVIVVIALLLGVDPSTVTPPPQTGTQQQEVSGFDVSQCKTAADANKIPECRIIATGNSVDAVWTQLMGRQYTRPHIRLFKGQVNTACGAATTDVGPFYCPGDDTAYFDTEFLTVLRDQLGSSTGPFAQEYIVAHEFGHHVQDLLGDLGRAQQPNAAQGANGAGVRTELQADCYAGVWAHYATIPQSNGTTYLDPLTDKDIADVMSATQAVGDDWIQKRTTGRVDPYSFTHGTSEQRQHWFNVGYKLGDPQRCDTFNTRDLG